MNIIVIIMNLKKILLYEVRDLRGLKLVRERDCRRKQCRQHWEEKVHRFVCFKSSQN